MKIPFSWLRKYLRLSQTPEEVSELLTLSGLEVEKIEMADFDFSSVVVGMILDIAPHPEADKLQILTLSDGEKKYQVVSGAPNLVKDSKIAFAKVDATLRGDDGNPLLIRKISRHLE